MNLRLLSFILTATTAIFSINAAHISPEKALQRAISQSSRIENVNISSATDSYSLIPQPLITQSANFGAHNRRNSQNIYIFNKKDNQGYLILPADDNITPILGYSDTGTFDLNNIPENMAYWLSIYDKEIDIHTTYTQPTVNTMNTAGNIEIKPLLTCEWGQDDPFNRKCPLYNDFTIGSTPVRSPTGCVATAMAQVMYYHRHPAKANDRFSDITFDWDNMLDRYTDSNFNETQANAVALLMNTCGQAVDMRYGKYESAAATSRLVYALGTYFGYEKSSMRILPRDYMPLGDIISALRKELQQKRPVIVGADSSDGGHAFVLDGCDKNNYFHINWGWDGNCNGYFLISALEPEIQGTGGGSGAFNYKQTFFVGIEKALPSPGEYADNDSEIVAAGDISFNTSGQWGTINDNTFFGFLNISALHDTFEFGIKAISKDDNSEYILWNNPGYKETKLGYASYIRNINFDQSIFRSSNNPTLKEGNYRLYLIYRTSSSGTIKTVLAPIGMQQYAEIRFDGRNYEVLPCPKESKLTLSNYDIPQSVPMGSSAVISVNVTNNDTDTYHGDIKATLTSIDTDYRMVLCAMMTDLSPNESINHTTNIIFGAPQGQYKILFTDIRNKVLGESSLLTIKEPDKSDLIAIDETNFPDEMFRKWLDIYDEDKDGYLSEKERNELKSMYISKSYNIRTLKGIEFFPCLTSITCRDNTLTNLDVSKLDNIEYISVPDNKLTELIIGKKPRLTELYCDNNSLTDLDLSGCSALKTAIGNNNSLTSLNIESCEELDYFYFPNNKLTSFRNRGNKALKELYINKNLLEELTLDNMEVLTKIEASENRLVKIDVSGCKELTWLILSFNRLTSIDLSTNTKMTDIVTFSNTLDVYTEERDGMKLFDLKNLEKYGFNIANFGDPSILVEGTKVNFGQEEVIKYYYKHGANISGGQYCEFGIRDIGPDPNGSIADVNFNTPSSVYSKSGTIIIKELPEGTNVKIYNAMGTLCYNGHESEIKIGSGAYIIVIGKTPHKVFVP